MFIVLFTWVYSIKEVFIVNTQTKVNILYDALGKAELIEMVLKSQGMDLEDIQKVKIALSEQIKRA